MKKKYYIFLVIIVTILFLTLIINKCIKKDSETKNNIENEISIDFQEENSISNENNILEENTIVEVTSAELENMKNNINATGNTEIYQVEEEKYVYRQFFYYLLGKDASIVSNGYETLLYDLALYDLISLQGIFDIAKKAPKSYERVSKIKADRINAFVDRLEELKAYELCDNLRDKTQETLRVYETSKLMYRDTNNNVEASMLCLRNRFDLTEVESRNPEGRKSAINI